MDSLTIDLPYTAAIIIPNWNGKKFLADMLDSILVQTFTDFRLFVVDDGSTDGSIDILREYACKDKRILYIVRNREPKGAQTCRNIGYELSKGAKYVLFFDNDDLVAPYCLEQRVNFMESHPELDFSIFPAINFRNQPFDITTAVWGYRYLDDSLKAILEWTLPMVGWTNIYKRISYEMKGLLWDEKLKSMQDSDFNIQAILKGCKFEYAGDVKPDYYYRVTEESISSKLYSKEHAESHVYLIKKILESLSEVRQSKYSKDLMCYFIKFVEILITHKEQVKKLIDTPWIFRHRWFFIRLKLWQLLGYKGRILYFLFFKEFYNFKQKQAAWKEFGTEKVNSILK
ncbi:MAG: glycosyltransferase [Bacteroidota bacterium]|nr:glycosyltransferase [Bacteroidota bacterium]